MNPVDVGAHLRPLAHCQLKVHFAFFGESPSASAESLEPLESLCDDSIPAPHATSGSEMAHTIGSRFRIGELMA
jgi:hypothetical protein